MTEIAQYGTASVKRVYGDWTKPQLASWETAASEHFIQPMQQFANTAGKNATDSALFIDAIDLLYTGRFQSFCIVSSDSDFTRLASRIREDGVTEYGFGEMKTPEAFRNACDRFTYLDVLAEPSTDVADPTAQKSLIPSAKLRTDGPLVRALRAAIGGASLDDGWSDLAVVGSLVRKQRPDFDSRNWGYAKFSDLVREIGLSEVAPRPGGGVRVRLTPQKT